MLRGAVCGVVAIGWGWADACRTSEPAALSFRPIGAAVVLVLPSALDNGLPGRCSGLSLRRREWTRVPAADQWNHVARAGGLAFLAALPLGAGAAFVTRRPYPAHGPPH